MSDEKKAQAERDEVAQRLERQVAFPACRYCGDRVSAKGAVHSRCEREADRLIDEDES